MVYALMSYLSILVVPAIACEGECIVQVTNAFVGNYSSVVNTVFTEAAAVISGSVLRSQTPPAVLQLMDPLREAYRRGAYDSMEKAIFPDYFHGKCQVNGIDPAGCPNPDCPVVCGTPGSLVHFYSVLKGIAFNATAVDLSALCAPSSHAYQAFQAAALRHLHTTTASTSSTSTTTPPPSSRRRRSWRSAPYTTASRLMLSDRGGNVRASAVGKGLWKRAVMSKEDAKIRLRAVCQRMVHDLTTQCGGQPSLSKCSWEEEMKAFILSFP